MSKTAQRVRVSVAAMHRILAVSLIACAAVALSKPAAAAANDCRVGSYRLADGSSVDIALSNGDTLRWRKFDGTTGALHPHPDGNWTGTHGWTDAPDGITVVVGGCGSAAMR